MKEYTDISGKRFGRLVAKRYIKDDGPRKYMWECQCDCGNITYSSITSLERGLHKSCGCIAQDKKKENLEELIGKKINRLFVLDFGKINKNHTYMKCQCDCGKVVDIRSDMLKRGRPYSCGCYARELQHSKANPAIKSRVYRIWRGIKQRCNNENSPRYYRYGGRGIKICDEWENDFMSFYNWSMEHGYADDLSVDRIDNDGNYCPENCRWATNLEQQNNTSYNRWIEFNGERHTLAQWAKILDIDTCTLHYRLKAGWSIERSLSPNVKRKNPSRPSTRAEV